MINYEKIAEEIEGVDPPKVDGPAFDASTVFPAQSPPESLEEAQARMNRIHLPLNHEKYQGIAEAKGYAQGDDYSGNRLKRVHYSHEAMIDVLISQPTITQNELAKQFGRSPTWISVVINSDSFQAALAKRRDDLLDPFVVASIEERFRGLAQQSLDVIAEKLEKTPTTDIAFKALEISAKALGFGARNTAGPAVQANFVVQLPPKIDNSSEWAKAHSGQIIDQ